MTANTAVSWKNVKIMNKTRLGFVRVLEGYNILKEFGSCK